MCGIAGILSFKASVEEHSIRKMTDVLVHRSPDGEGIWRSENGRVSLGHRRLTIIDLTDNGRQPMQYADGRYSITFNGEVYNYIELKQGLISKGYRFVSTSDTEVLLALYDLKKDKCLEELDGMFAFAIWDKQEQTLFCARDRFGEKPFYYFCDSNYFAFASEMKSLFALGIKRNPERKKIFNSEIIFGKVKTEMK